MANGREITGPSGFNAEVTSDNKLQVQANISALPATPVEYKVVNLLNGSSPDMDVNGSSTPVEFTFHPGTDETWYVERITFIIDDSGSSDPNDYGAITGSLSNGCLLEIKSNGATIEQANLKNNIGIALSFAEETFVNTTGFMANTDIYRGSIKYLHPYAIKDSTSDFVKMTIRDNITGLNFQQVQILLWREQ